MSAPRWKIEQRDLRGRIKWFSITLSYGFILPDDGGEDVHTHLTNILDEYVPQSGDEVQYDIARGVGPEKSKRLTAINVRLLLK